MLDESQFLQPLPLLPIEKKREKPELEESLAPKSKYNLSGVVLIFVMLGNKVYIPLNPTSKPSVGITQYSISILKVTAIKIR